MSQDETERSKWLVPSIVSFLVLVFVVGIWLLACNLTLWLSWVDYPQTAVEYAGTFGDSFGAVNALFSGLAFAGVIIAIFLQSRELYWQRIEVRGSTKALEAQEKQLTKQVELMDRNAFENRLFQMLSSLSQLIDGSRVLLNNKEEWVGRFAFYQLSNKVKDVAREGADRLNQNYMKFDREWGFVVGQYFRLLYYIIVHIDDSTLINREEKDKYSRIVRAHLSQSELLLLFFSSLSDKGSNFQGLIKKYDLLQNTDLEGINKVVVAKAQDYIGRVTS